MDHIQLRPRYQIEANPGPHLVYGFLTAAANAVVAPIHPKAMPVILTPEEDASAAV
jgi:putative SOS response-associated peptidase YedK